MTFEIKNKDIAPLLTWMGELGKLTGKQVRERTRFIDIFRPRVEQNIKLWMEILKKYSNLDEKGEPAKKMIGPVEHFDIPEDKVESYEKEYSEFLDENYVLDITESNKITFREMKNLVLNTEFTFGPKEGDNPIESDKRIRQANDYAIWCKSFEKLEV